MPRVVALAVAYAVMGVVSATLVYSLTGVSELHRSYMSGGGFPTPRLAEVPALVFVFLYSRGVLVVLEAIALALCVRLSVRAPLVLFIGVSIPIVFEILIARTYTNSWVWMGWYMLHHSPPWPRYLIPEVVYREAAGFLVPTVLAGIVASAWAVSMQRSSSGRLAPKQA